MSKTVKVDNDLFFKAVKDTLNMGNQAKFCVVGDSMMPFLKNGDKVTVQRIKKGDIKLGAILLGHWQNGYVLHRVVKYKAGAIWLAGDNNISQLERLEMDQVIGRVIYAFRGDKNIMETTIVNRTLGMIWYYMRPFRLIGIKIKKLNNKFRNL